MTTVATRRPITDALLVLLRSLTTPDGTPLRIGDHHAPDPAPDQPEPELPFAVVSDVSGILTGPVYGDPHADGRWTFQVQSVGTNRRSAEALRDFIRSAVLSLAPNGYTNPISPTGATVIDRYLESEGPTIQVGDWWNATDQLVLQTTPS
jgi:hypothetical protein